MTPDDVIRIFLARVFGPWRRLWAGLSRRARRIVKVIGVVLVLVFVPGGVAYADGSNTPSALSWINYEDSYGLKIWQYELSLDRGGATSPLKVIWSFFIDIGWQLYRAWIGVSCWLIDWTLSFAWLDWITEPAMALGDAMQQVVDQFGATTALLTITACAAVLMMMRGKWATGIFELFLSLIIASLAVGILSNPVDTVAGDDGVLVGSRDMGLQVASGLQNDGDTSGDPEETREDVISMIVETFLRRPSQLVNFGVVLDGTDCEEPYQDVIEDGPYGDEPDIRNDLDGDACGDLGEGAKNVADNPNASMFMSMMALYPTAFVVLLFALILCGAVIVSGAQAVYQGIKMIIALVLALLPNSARGSLWYTFASVLIAMVEVVFAVVFLTAYLLVIQNLLAGDDPIRTFFIIDVMMFVGIILFWKGRARIKAATARLAAAMARRPGEGGSGASQLPKQGSWRPNLADAYHASHLAGRLLGRGKGPSGDRAIPQRAPGNAAPSRIPETTATRGPGAPGGGQLPGKGGPSGAPVPVGPAGSPDSSSAARVLERIDKHNTTSRRLGEVTKVATSAAMAAATGGGSAAAQVAAKKAAAKLARRKAIESRLRSAQTSSTTSGGRRLQRNPSSAPTVSAPSSAPGQGGSDAAARLQARLQARGHGRR